MGFARGNGVIAGRSGGDRHLGKTITLRAPLAIARSKIDRVVAVLNEATADLGRRSE